MWGIVWCLNLSVVAIDCRMSIAMLLQLEKAGLRKRMEPMEMISNESKRWRLIDTFSRAIVRPTSEVSIIAESMILEIPSGWVVLTEKKLNIFPVPVGLSSVASVLRKFPMDPGDGKFNMVG